LRRARRAIQRVRVLGRNNSHAIAPQ
jgi:hypothetical protein